MKQQRRLGWMSASVLAILLFPACSSDHGSHASDLLVVTPDPNVRASAVAAKEQIGCDPLPEQVDSSQSTLVFSGPCSFAETAAVHCVDRVDDFYAYINRDLPDNGHLAGIINVEKYKGPGTYTHNSVVYLQVSRNGQLYLWRQEAATLTVTADQHHIVVGKSELLAEKGSPASGTITVEGTAVCNDVG